MTLRHSSEHPIGQFSPAFNDWLNREKMLAARRQRLFTGFGLAFAILLLIAIVLEQVNAPSSPYDTVLNETKELTIH